MTPESQTFDTWTGILLMHLSAIFVINLMKNSIHE